MLTVCNNSKITNSAKELQILSQKAGCMMGNVIAVFGHECMHICYDVFIVLA